ncbi:MAG: MogA/MoaB family molybdenum cofactor biosynthesis protein [Acidimicrobiia bacterium]|nr:MogA/MoaB family molybdenum cofactor biosynthesis protein [Acidimicrobiia bacterium]
MRAAVVTVSDRVSQGTAEDLSGPAAVNRLAAYGIDGASLRVVPDGVESVRSALEDLMTDHDLIVTTGGTGFSPRDVTPEATRLVIDREAPGLAEAMRAATFGRFPHGMLSRGVSGIAGSTLIVNLPGSVKAVEESLDIIGPALSHGIELLIAGQSDHNM